MRFRAILAAGIGAIALAAGDASAAPGPGVIDAYPTRVGAYVHSPYGSSYPRFVKAFGAPIRIVKTSQGHGQVVCRGRWPEVRMTAWFLTLARNGGCGTRSLIRDSGFSGAVVRGPGWLTRASLAIGDPLTRLREVYPLAHRGRDGWWWLKQDPDTYVPGPWLSALIQDDTVVALRN